jgi:hypothetical protein
MSITSNLTGAGWVVSLNGATPTWVFPAPPTATTVGTPGQMSFDASFFYVCVAVNTWVRVGLATW